MSGGGGVAFHPAAGRAGAAHLLGPKAESSRDNRAVEAGPGESPLGRDGPRRVGVAAPRARGVEPAGEVAKAAGRSLARARRGSRLLLLPRRLHRQDELAPPLGGRLQHRLGEARLRKIEARPVERGVETRCALVEGQRVAATRGVRRRPNGSRGRDERSDQSIRRGRLGDHPGHRAGRVGGRGGEPELCEPSGERGASGPAGAEHGGDGGAVDRPRRGDRPRGRVQTEQ